MGFAIKSSAVELSDTASTVSNANRVLLQYTGTGQPIVTIKSDDTFQPGSAAIQGSVMVDANNPIVIKKDRLFTYRKGEEYFTINSSIIEYLKPDDVVKLDIQSRGEANGGYSFTVDVEKGVLTVDEALAKYGIGE